MKSSKVFKRVFLAPLLLLVGAEGDPQSAAAPAVSAVPAAPPAAPTAAEQPTSQAPTAAAVAAEVMSAIDKRSQRLEGSITKAVAEKYGMSEADVTELLEAEKKKREKALPASVQKQLDAAMNAANDKLIAAEIRVQATALGFVDVDDALRLAVRDGVKVDDKGDVTGVKEALEALAKAKPHLIKPSGAWGARQGSPAGDEKSLRDELKEKMFGGKK